jgi:hypothetical protein
MDKGLVVDAAGLLSGTFAKLQKAAVRQVTFCPSL